MNWRRVQRSKRLGGLGVKDLSAFNRALRLRWAWFKWTDQSRPWTGMPVHLNPIERALFQLCTTITIGNGARTSFWHDQWLDGEAPKDIAPDCFRWAWRKNHSVAAALTARQWMRGLHRMNTEPAARQFVVLWNRLQQVRLADQEDTVSWRFTANGTYSASSAYDVQFHGSFGDQNWDTIWRAKVENKTKIFVWLLLQRRLPTNDRVIKHGGQANPICQLCHIGDETTTHIMAKCSYATEVWRTMATRTQLFVPPTLNMHRIKDWWTRLSAANSQHLDRYSQVIIYTAWNIWKEFWRRVFDNKAQRPSQLVEVITQDLHDFSLAREQD